MIEQDWLQNLDETTREAVTNCFEDVSLAAGELLFSQGDPGDSMYLVTRGQLDILIKDPEGNEWLVARHGPGGILGEMALLTGRKRVATVKAHEAALVKRLAKTDFDSLCREYSPLMAAFNDLLEPRLQISQMVDVLSGLFGVLNYETIQELQKRLTWKHIPAGTTIDFQEEPQGSMFIVVNGRLRVKTETPNLYENMVAEICRGDTYGDFNLLSGENSRIVLTALRDSDVVRLSQDVLESLLRQNPQSVMKFVRRTSMRQQTPTATLRNTALSGIAIALVPLGPGQPVRELAEKLSLQLDAYGNTLYLNSQLFDERYGREGAAQTETADSNNIAINQWLAEKERSHNFVLYEADSKWTPWTQRCLRQADRIVLVSEANRDPSPGELEETIKQQQYAFDQELALVYPENTTLPEGTRAWLTGRNLKRFHHVRLTNRNDIGRLARRLIGKEIGLVLSGGGSRGFAHLGVFRALQEAGIPVDIIGGASMGALIGGALCQGNSYEEILGYAARHGSPRALYDFTLPAISFLASKKLTRMLDVVFEERRIEDMWRPFFCLSTDLTLAAPIIHQEGLAWQAVRGSIALPGIFAPYLFQGNVVVDGGVMNNFPIDLMRQKIPGGWVIGVNVSPPRELSRDYHFESGVSGWQAVLDKLNPFGRRIKVPSIFSTLTRSVEVRGIYQMATVAGKADRIIQPNVAQFNYLDFRPAPDIAEAGYQATVEIIDDLVEQFQAAGFCLE